MGLEAVFVIGQSLPKEFTQNNTMLFFFLKPLWTFIFQNLITLNPESALGCLLWVFPMVEQLI